MIVYMIMQETQDERGEGTGESSTRASEAESDAHQIMTEKLPLYVVKCFEAAGFDTLEVIAEMNVGNEPGNSIEQIEHFITDQFPDDPEYQRGKKFPPGHKIRIQRLVEEVKQNLSRKSQGKGKKGLFKGE